MSTISMKRRTALLGAAMLGVLAAAPVRAQTAIDFYYPIQVGGPLTKVIDGYIAKFTEANPGIKVNAVYSGNYTDTTTKASTAAKSGAPPAVAVLLATDIFSLIDEDIVEPVGTFIKTDADRAWLAGFMPAYLKSAQVGGKLWSIPFQRSTAVLYYNKDVFASAGLDPNKPPKTWAEMVAAGKAVLQKDASGKVTRWGVGIPGNIGSSQWMFGALVAQNGGRLMNDEGTETYLTDQKVIDALQFWVDLSVKEGVHPPGIQEWGTTPQDFLEQRIAMIWTTTGNLTNIARNASFKFGLAPYPGNPKPASVLGGGNFYIFKKAPEAQKEAAFKLVKFLTTDELQADWAIQTGYVAPRDGAWEVPILKEYTAKLPDALVAKNQIPDSVPEFSTYESARTTRVLNDAISAALTGSKTPRQALTEAQVAIERILRPYRR